MDKVFSSSNRKIDLTCKVGHQLDGTLDDNNRVETGPTALAFAEWMAAGLGACTGNFAAICKEGKLATRRC